MDENIFPVWYTGYARHQTDVFCRYERVNQTGITLSHRTTDCSTPQGKRTYSKMKCYRRARRDNFLKEV